MVAATNGHLIFSVSSGENEKRWKLRAKTMFSIYEALLTKNCNPTLMIDIDFNGERIAVEENVIYLENRAAGQKKSISKSQAITWLNTVYGRQQGEMRHISGADAEYSHVIVLHAQKTS